MNSFCLRFGPNWVKWWGGDRENRAAQKPRQTSWKICFWAELQTNEVEVD